MNPYKRSQDPPLPLGSARPTASSSNNSPATASTGAPGGGGGAASSASSASGAGPGGERDPPRPPSSSSSTTIRLPGRTNPYLPPDDPIRPRYPYGMASSASIWGSDRERERERDRERDRERERERERGNNRGYPHPPLSGPSAHAPPQAPPAVSSSNPNSVTGSRNSSIFPRDPSASNSNSASSSNAAKIPTTSLADKERERERERDRIGSNTGIRSGALSRPLEIEKRIEREKQDFYREIEQGQREQRERERDASMGRLGLGTIGGGRGYGAAVGGIGGSSGTGVARPSGPAGSNSGTSNAKNSNNNSGSSGNPPSSSASGAQTKETGSSNASTNPNPTSSASSHSHNNPPSHSAYRSPFSMFGPPGRTSAGTGAPPTSSTGTGNHGGATPSGPSNNSGNPNTSSSNATSSKPTGSGMGSSYVSPYASFFGGGSARRTGFSPLDREREREREREVEEGRDRERGSLLKREWEEKRRRGLLGSGSTSGPGSGVGSGTSGTGTGAGASATQKGEEQGGGSRFKTPSALLPSPRSVPSTPGLGSSQGQGQGKSAGGDGNANPQKSGPGAKVGLGGLGPSSTGSGTSGGPTSAGFNPLTSRTLPSPFDRPGPGSQPGTPGIKIEGPAASGSTPTSSSATTTGGMKLSSLLGPGGSVQSDRPVAGQGSSVSPRPSGAAPTGTSASSVSQPGAVGGPRSAYGFMAPHSSMFGYDSSRQKERARLRESERDWEREREGLAGKRERSGSASTVVPPGSVRAGSSALSGSVAASYPSNAGFDPNLNRNRNRGLSFGSGTAGKSPVYDYPASSLKTDLATDRLPPLGSSSSSSLHSTIPPGPLSSSLVATERERDIAIAKERERERERSRRDLVEREKERDREQERARAEHDKREQYERDSVKESSKMAFYMRNPNAKLPPPYASRDGRTATASSHVGGTSESTHRRSPSNDPAGMPNSSFQDAMLDRDRKDGMAASARRQMELERTAFYDRSGMFRSRAAGGAVDIDMEHGRSTPKQAIEVLNRPVSPITSSVMAQTHPAAFPPPAGSLSATGYSDMIDQSIKSAPGSPSQNPLGSSRHGKREFDTHEGSKQVASLGHGVPTSASGSKSHKRKRSQAYAQDSREVDLDKMEVDADPKTSGKKRSSKNTNGTRDQREGVVALQYPATVAPQVNYGMLSLPPALTLDVRSESVEVHLRNLGIKALLQSLGKTTYKGWDWLLDAQVLSDNIGGTMEILIPGQYLPSPHDQIRGWAVRGEKEWDEAVSEAGRNVMSQIPGYNDRRLWGSDVYTDDSDVLAVMIHSSWLRPIPAAFGRRSYGETLAPNKRSRRPQDDLKVLIRVAPKLIRYVASERAGFASRGWGNSHDGVSYVVETVSRIQPQKPFTQSRKNSKLRMAANLLQRRLAFGNLCSDNGITTWPHSGIEGLQTDLEMDDGVDEMTRESDLTFLRSGHVGSVYKPSLLRSWHLPLEGEVQSPVKSDALNAVDAIAHHAGLGVSPEEGVKKNIWIRDLILEAGIEEYRLTSSAGSTPLSPSFNLTLIPPARHSDRQRIRKAVEPTSNAKEKPEETGPALSLERVVVQGVNSSDLTFVDNGLLVRNTIEEDRKEDSGWLLLVDRFAWVEKSVA